MKPLSAPSCPGRHRSASGARLGLALIVLPFAVLPAGAQEPEVPADRFYETATVRERPLESATVSISVIDRAAIEASGARNVAELLAWAPGIGLSTNGTRGGFTTAQIRGGDPNFTLVLLDGVPLNDPTYPVGDAYDLEGLATSAIDRIEIVRGPLSARYGSTGLSGAIHLFTREGASGPPSVEAEALAGDAHLRGGSASLSGGVGEAGTWFVGLSSEEERQRVADERFRQLSVQGSLNLPLRSGARLLLRSRYTGWDGDDYPDASGGPAYGSGELRRSQHTESSLGAELRLGAEGRHRLSLAAYRHDLDSASPAVGFQVPQSQQESRFTTARLGWSSVLLARRGLQWTGGVDVTREEGDNASTLFLPPFLGGTVAGDYDIRRTLPGAYSELVAERGRLAVELGLRFDKPQDAGSQWSPRLGLSWRLPGDRGRLHASAGRAFKLPSFFALASPRELGGNPNLKPETSYAGDLGIDWRIAPRLEAGVTVYRQRYDNLIDFDFASFLHVNRSQVESQGVETTLAWQASDRLRLEANGTWQEVEDRRTHIDLRHRPKRFGGLRLLWRPTDRLDLDLGSTSISSSFDEQIPVPERSTVAGYALVGLNARWRIAGGWQLGVKADNLTDRDYETLIGFPGPGRSLRVSLGWKPKR